MMDRTGVLGWMATAGVAAGMVLAGPTAEAGGVPPSYGFDFATIGDVGNPDYPALLSDPRGGVDYTYRIAKTEVRAVEWLEFVRAYAPHYTPGEVGGGVNATGLTGQYIDQVGTLSDATPDFRLDPSNNNRPANMSWYMAARYCNWLHNGKASGKWAFEDGAYDTSVFEQIDANEFTMKYARRPDAKYWIPSVDEWTKAAFWDPNRNGDGLGGYWSYPNTSDVAPISGLPGEGGETGAGDFVLELPDPYVTEFVGLYPSVQSPWGLLDLSGTRSNWTEYGGGPPSTFRLGTFVGLPANEIFDMLEQSFFPGGLDGSSSGLRIASAVPGPGGSACFLLIAAHFTSRRKQRVLMIAEPFH